MAKKTIPKAAKTVSCSDDGKTVSWKSGGKLYTVDDPDLWERIHRQIEPAFIRIVELMKSKYGPTALKACEMMLNYGGIRITSKTETVSKNINVKLTKAEYIEEAERARRRFNEKFTLDDLPEEMREKLDVKPGSRKRIPEILKRSREN